MERHARLVELVNRLGGDLWPRLITAAGVAVVLWLYMDARLALIWLVLIGVNESFELWAAQGIRKGGSMAGRFEAAALAPLTHPADALKRDGIDARRVALTPRRDSAQLAAQAGRAKIQARAKT